MHRIKVGKGNLISANERKNLFHSQKIKGQRKKIPWRWSIACVSEFKGQEEKWCMEITDMY